VLKWGIPGAPSPLNILANHFQILRAQLSIATLGSLSYHQPRCEPVLADILLRLIRDRLSLFAAVSEWHVNTYQDTLQSI
jgi:hypothetical protein